MRNMKTLDLERAPLVLSFGYYSTSERAHGDVISCCPASPLHSYAASCFSKPPWRDESAGVVFIGLIHEAMGGGGMVL